MPALLTRMSILPKASMVDLIRRSMSSGEVTSVGVKRRLSGGTLADSRRARGVGDVTEAADGDPGARRGEPDDYGLSDSPGAPGYDGYLSGKALFHFIVQGGALFASQEVFDGEGGDGGSMRRTRLLSILPGPTSTKVSTPAPIMYSTLRSQWTQWQS